MIVFPSGADKWIPHLCWLTTEPKMPHSIALQFKAFNFDFVWDKRWLMGTNATLSDNLLLVSLDFHSHWRHGSSWFLSSLVFFCLCSFRKASVTAWNSCPWPFLKTKNIGWFLFQHSPGSLLNPFSGHMRSRFFASTKPTSFTFAMQLQLPWDNYTLNLVLN